MRISPLWLAASAVALSASLAGAVTQLSRGVIGSGAGTASGPAHAIAHTLGQTVAGQAHSATALIGSGFWLVPPATSTGVGDGPTPLIPAAFSLHQNLPNPFNPRTSIQFDLSQPASRVSLRIYDLSGRLVATLAQGDLPAGRHSVIWAGDDDRGRSVASGIYVYVLETPTDRATRKLAIVR
jgi:flagellar hook assembly protein FlgD